MQISVFQTRELQAVILALKGMDRDLAAQIRKATKSVTQTEWQKALAVRASTPLEKRVLVNTARVSVTNQNISLRAGQLKTRIGKGGPQAFTLTPGVEFGAQRNAKGQSTSRRGKTYDRRTKRQFKQRNRKGTVAYPAAAKVIPRIAALWVQTTVRTFHEALEKGTR